MRLAARESILWYTADPERVEGGGMALTGGGGCHLGPKSWQSLHSSDERRGYGVVLLSSGWAAPLWVVAVSAGQKQAQTLRGVSGSGSAPGLPFFGARGWIRPLPAEPLATRVNHSVIAWKANIICWLATPIRWWWLTAQPFTWSSTFCGKFKGLERTRPAMRKALLWLYCLDAGRDSSLTPQSWMKEAWRGHICATQ